MGSSPKLFRAVWFAAGVMVSPLSSIAQTGPAPLPTSADPVQDAAKQAFEALPEADRIAIQDGLIWTGDYKGVADGKFGKGTRDAVAAFAARNKLPPDGTLDAKGRAALAAAARQSKESLRFLIQTDAKTGLQIGIPLKLLTKVKPLAAGTRYSSADESISIETSTRAASSSALQDAFLATTADQPGRKVTYKILRPEFFVVAGEIGTNAFYTRMAHGQRGGNATLNGFTLTYPIAQKARLDPMSVAIANSFNGFPDASSVAASPVANAPAAATANAAAPVGRGILTASGVSIAPNLVLTSLPKACREPQIGAQPAKIVKQDEAGGLTLLTRADAASAILPIRANDPTNTAQIVTLSFTSRTASGDELTGTSGDLFKTNGPGAWRLLAPVQNPVAGTAILDRSGALAGIIPLDAGPAKLIAGVLPQAHRDVIPASKLISFLADARPKPAEHLDPHTLGEIVTLSRGALVAVYCAP